MNWQITTYHPGISQISKCIQVLSGMFPKRGKLLQCMRSREIMCIKRTLCAAKSRETLHLLKQIFNFKHERWTLKWGKYTWTHEKAGLSVGRTPLRSTTQLETRAEQTPSSVMAPKLSSGICSSIKASLVRVL